MMIGTQLSGTWEQGGAGKRHVQAGQVAVAASTFGA